MNTFKQFQVNNEPAFHTSIVDKEFPELTNNEVWIKIAYSDVNYKDALACSENGQVIRTYPMTPGIDFSGVVMKSLDKRFQPGDQVLATGYGIGVSQPGGYSDYQKITGDWLVPLPETMTLRQAMVLGTAGLTAALCVNALLSQGMKADDHIVVTGASGGVGSVAIAMLHKMGFKKITAFSRKEEAQTWLQKLGATQVVHPEAFLPEKVNLWINNKWIM